MSNQLYTLYACKRCGSEIVELLLEESGLPYQVEWMVYKDLPENESYAKLNFLKQVPALKLPDGQLMTESLAMMNYLNETAGLGLVPAASEKVAPAYWRWSVFLVASIYPTFTYADDTSRWTADKNAQKEMENHIRDFRKKMWRGVEAAAAETGPYFLGERRTLIDYYIAVMTEWGPGADWFIENTPRLTGIASRLRKSPNLQKIFERNLGDD